MKRHDVIVAIPHAGTHIPQEIRPLIPHNDHTIRNESDLYTDRIYMIDGPRVVKAKHSRIISDCNRAPDEIYSEGILRALGVTMLSFPTGEDVFTEDPPLEAMHSWIQKYHEPFHEELRTQLPGAQFLFDCHSLWSQPAKGHMGGTSVERADIVLGNQYFCSCSAETTDFVAQFFRDHGYSVAINAPYPGRYILGTYCSRIGLPGIQIEINRKLYLNEETLDPNEQQIEIFNKLFEKLVDAFCAWYEGPSPADEKPMTDLSE